MKNILLLATFVCFFIDNSFAQNTLPEFMGGQEALFGFVAENIAYPPDAIAKCQQGTVLVRFKITEKGTIDSLEIKNNVPHAALCTEALRLVRLTEGQWKPAMVEGGMVPSYFTLPVRFVLQPDADCPTETDYYNQAVALLNKNEYTQAVQAATQAININPFGKYYYQVRGRAYIALGNKSAACADFEQSVLFGNSNAQILIDQNCN